MSKAEDRANETYPVKKEWVGNQYGAYGDVNARFRAIYQEGYHQAEKDLALSWEDIQTICRIESEVDAQYCKDGVYSIPIDDVYKEVLRRFNEQKRNKV